MEKQKWGWWSVFWKAFRDASPVIFFFLFLFSVVYILFGMQYGMIVSVVTIFFQTCYKNNNHTFFSYLKLILVGSILIVLAYASSLNFLSCVFLNITVPFVLVFTQSSQYRPKGYFSYAMMFVFVSLIPAGQFSGTWNVHSGILVLYTFYDDFSSYIFSSVFSALRAERFSFRSAV